MTSLLPLQRGSITFCRCHRAAITGRAISGPFVSPAIQRYIMKSETGKNSVIRLRDFAEFLPVVSFSAASEVFMSAIYRAGSAGAGSEIMNMNTLDDVAAF